MNTQYSPALHQAIDAFRAPGLYLRLREHNLPEDMLLLLRIAAGDSQAIELATTASQETASAVSEAAVMFIQHLMFYPGSSSFRVLGVQPSASDAQIKEHYRWLVRWLHPDRNSDEWDAVYAERVTLAWQDLRTPERRRAYEAAHAHAHESESPTEEWDALPAKPVTPAQRVRPMEHDPGEFVLSTRTVRRLPAMILAGVTICVAAVLGLQYVPLQDAPAPAAAAVAESPEASDQTAPVDLAAIRAGKRDADYVLGTGSPASRVNPEPAAVPVPAPAPGPDQALLASAPPAPAVPEAKAASARPERPTVPVVRQLPMATAPARPQPSLASRAERKVAPRTQALAAEATQPVAPKASVVDSIPPPGALAASPVAKMDEAAARDVILRFRSAYASGNLNQVRSLLARNSDELDREQAATLRTYRKLFESSVSRHMEISNPSWLADRDTAILVASFEAWIQPVGKAEQRRVQGDIRFDLRSEDGEMRIIRVRHVAKGG